MSGDLVKFLGRGSGCELSAPHRVRVCLCVWGDVAISLHCSAWIFETFVCKCKLLQLLLNDPRTERIFQSNQCTLSKVYSGYKSK